MIVQECDDFFGSVEIRTTSRVFTIGFTGWDEGIETVID